MTASKLCSFFAGEAGPEVIEDPEVQTEMGTMKVQEDERVLAEVAPGLEGHAHLLVIRDTKTHKLRQR